MRKEINEVTKITASCGIACNKMLAKICSEINKPNG
jgi:DNA polymerase kappa